MKVLVKRPFHLIRAGQEKLVLDMTGRSINIRVEDELYYLDFPRGALEITPDELRRHLENGDLEEAP